jgi:hypothetical protein
MIEKKCYAGTSRLVALKLNQKEDRGQIQADTNCEMTLTLHPGRSAAVYQQARRQSHQRCAAIRSAVVR